MIHQGKYYQCPVESGHTDGMINVAMAFGVTIEECKANAKLIASAPLLAEENEKLRAEVERLKIESSKFAYEAGITMMTSHQAQAERIKGLEAENSRLNNFICNAQGAPGL